MPHVLRLGPITLFIPSGFLFGLAFILFGFLFGVSCVGASEERSVSHDAKNDVKNDRSSRLASARTSGRENTAHGSSRTSGDHKAAAGEHEPASIRHGTADTGHETATAGHGAASTGPGTADPGSAGHGAQGQGEAPHWAYDGDLGPSHWGDLADQIAAFAAIMRPNNRPVQAMYSRLASGAGALFLFPG